MSTPERVRAIAEDLLRAYATGDAQLMTRAIGSPALKELDSQHQGLGNIHLAFAFAQLLDAECPVQARDGQGVPLLALLVEDRGDDVLDARVALGEELGRPVAVADAKASAARFSHSVPLAQAFVQCWRLRPGAVTAFVQLHSGQSPAMVDEVWGVLSQACATIRATVGK